MPNIEPQSTFFNVMPDAASARKVAPTPRKVDSTKTEAVFGTNKFTPSAASAPTAPSITFTKQKPGLLSRKWVLICLLLILVSIIGGGVWFFLKAKNKPAPPAEEAPAKEEAPVPTPDVTTSPSWLNAYFGSETCVNKNQCADASDPDFDGFSNKEEFEEATDPNNPDSDKDGIADGDEFHIFETEPLMTQTYREGNYNDADFIKGGFDIHTNVAYTPEQLAEIKARVKERGLHQPTVTTIGPVALALYEFKDPDSGILDDLNIDQSPQAKLERDTQRQSTIKKIGGALLKYKEAKRSFPATNDFIAMSDDISSYNTVATNYNDPINKDKYVYGYAPSNNNLNFTLTYYSETQNQLIKYTSKDAEDNALEEESDIENQQRMTDLESIKSALLIYSASNIDSNSDKLYVFPLKSQYPDILVQNRYFTTAPKDPNGSDYLYEVSDNQESFTLKAIFSNPPSGQTGYMCTELECKNY